MERVEMARFSQELATLISRLGAGAFTRLICKKETIRECHYYYAGSDVPNSSGAFDNFHFDVWRGIDVSNRAASRRNISTGLLS
jgi:hypothetical protein